ncbi:hypothetical protein ACNTMW_06340 [Planosporangium sp. 12N6]|uniref:hypothetical protein n=1 Tax=Planosporangium spinosum TaxID=3402278 RepID=UPI003CF6B3EF
MAETPPDVPLRRAVAVPDPARPHHRLPRALARMNVHVPIRPLWVCAGCGAPWPCETRRHQLGAEFDGTPVSLGLLMGGYFVDCCADLPNRAVGELYGRFLGWLTQQPAPYEDQEP